MAAPPRIERHKPHFHRNAPVKEPVRVATTAAGTLASSFENGDTIDGVVLATGDRILVKNQAAGAENGIYVVAASGAPARAYDFSDDGAEAPGALVLVLAGTVNAGTAWYCTNATAPTFGTTAIGWEQLTGGSAPLIPFDLGDLGATETIDVATNGLVQRGNLDQAVAITVTGFTVDELEIAYLEFTGTGAITWDADVDFGGGDDQPNASGSTIFLLVSSVGDSDIKLSKFGGGGSALTVEDEGTPLATAATTLDFVGAGVTASGAGAEKTITIPGTPTGAAGGDLSGTYPNPAVVDDSHLHTTATLPADFGTSLVTIDAGTTTYDDAGDDVDVTHATDWGIDPIDGGYYDEDGAVSGEEAALLYDEANCMYVLVPLNCELIGS